jgi:glucose-6-phosphate isomerase
VVVITDPKKGDLRKWADSENVETLAIHPSIGGRFSVFSPVGFFAGALAGLNMTEFNEGAKLARTAFTDQLLEKNPIAILASELLRHAGKRSIHVCMPYSTLLRKLGLWFVQLWAESLGKDGKGFTPIAALGTTDQHSIVQLLRDGPDDKVTWFFKVDRYEDPVSIPKGPTANGEPLASFQLLEGSTLADLLEVEYLATAKVMLKQNRPTLTFKLDRLDEKNLGACLFSLCMLTALTGTMMQINPFDQPGVEEGKIYIRESLLAARGSN